SRAVIEHPEWMPSELKNRPDLNDGKHTGRIWRIVPESRSRLPGGTSGGPARHTGPSLSKSPTTDLVKLLDHADAWWRTTAQRLLLESQDPAAEPLLRQLLEGSSQPTARIHAAWLLQHADRLQEADVERLLRDDHRRVREHAVKLAEHWLPTSPKI